MAEGSSKSYPATGGDDWKSVPYDSDPDVIEVSADVAAGWSSSGRPKRKLTEVVPSEIIELDADDADDDPDGVMISGEKIQNHKNKQAVVDIDWPEQSKSGMFAYFAGSSAIPVTMVGQSDVLGVLHQGTSSEMPHQPSQTKIVNSEVDEKYETFKKFDTVNDNRDHFYSLPGKYKAHAVKKAWVKRIQHEWKVLENDLPDAIYVRVYEDRMDLLRAVIVGPAGTPYHDGLFFFDVHFPSRYPSQPPHFEDFIVGHFRNYGHKILKGCKSYMAGAQVGCLVGDGVQDVDEGDKSCSANFKASLKVLFADLLKEFANIGVDCVEFQNPGAAKATAGTSLT
nr:unnamed protein product [Digitaria exilis]